MRSYELMCLIRPELTEQELQNLSQELQNEMQGLGGEVENVDVWGKRTLAYPIKKRKEGYYIVYNFKFPQTQLKELERRLKLKEDVLRYLLILRDRGEE
ncbi:MAG: 30S ribosomal protein S6 [Dictyoglomus sp. NZ13-RE01]|nr:MAG: 30S ribosomal protein S6 [Dictyoglomus sp. NZ13-RE01]